MKVRFNIVETGLFKVVTDTKGGIVVGYLRYDGRPRYQWVLVDHIAGHEAGALEGSANAAKTMARKYFADKAFCAEGCGRLTGAGVCANCMDARKLSAKTERALCWVRGPFGDIYKVVKLDETFVIVGNTDHWSPAIYSAATVLEDLNTGLKTLVLPADLPSDVNPL